jgi:hypothetical protein
MRFSPAAACLLSAAFSVTLQASIMPTFELGPQTLQAFETYVAQFQKNVAIPYAQTGKMWLDTDSCCGRNGAFTAGKPVVQPRENTDIAGGSIHHFSGVIHIAGGTIAGVRHIMQDYGNYPKYFKPDVGKAAGAMEPDSTPVDEHYISHISLIQSTLWIAVSYDCVYNTHYMLFDPHHWASESSATSIREWRDPRDVTQGYFPEGNDHGFLWRTNTFWFVREANGGVDVELDSMSLSRPVPTGFGWWGARRTRDAVDKMLRDMKAAVEALRAA